MLMSLKKYISLTNALHQTFFSEDAKSADYQSRPKDDSVDDFQSSDDFIVIIYSTIQLYSVSAYTVLLSPSCKRYVYMFT